MRKKKKTEFEGWFDEQVQSHPDFKRQVQETLQGMKLKQETTAFFAERRRADFKAFDRLMNRTEGEPPREGAEMVGGEEEMKAVWSHGRLSGLSKISAFCLLRWFVT